MKTTVSISDGLAAQAQAAGLNVSATLREALRERLSPESGPITLAVDGLFGSVEVESTVDRVRGELAKALARKIDASRWSDSAAMAMACASLVRELGDILDALPVEQPHDALWELRQRRAQRLAAGAATRNGHVPGAR